MKQESILKKRYFEQLAEDVSKMSKEKILVMMQELDELYPSEFMEMFSKAYFGGIYAKYAKSDVLKTKQLLKEIQILEDCKDIQEKQQLFKEIAEKVDKQLHIGEYDINGIPEALEDLAMCAFEFKDACSCIRLLKKRREILSCFYECDVKNIPDVNDSFDAREIYKKLIKMIVMQCDDITADMFIQEMREGKYFKLSHSTEHGGWDIWDSHIIEAFKAYKFLKTMSSTTKDILEIELL
ncbi:MAG: hypothetical protein E7379_03255 [Clostridiales bacterium]|nr:hypothetical protein [Clostridiales bacterium]